MRLLVVEDNARLAELICNRGSRRSRLRQQSVARCIRRCARRTAQLLTMLRMIVDIGLAGQRRKNMGVRICASAGNTTPVPDA